MGSLPSIEQKTVAGKPVTMTTAYEASLAQIVDESTIDMLLVGDSVGVASLGYDTPDRVSLDEMVHHAAAVTRTIDETVVVVDMPFGTYNASPADAVRAATRLKKEGGADAVKIEGGQEVVEAVEAIVEGGIPVFGHLGSTPQTDEGLSTCGRTAKEAHSLLGDASALDQAGVTALVLKTIATEVAAAVGEAVDAFTIGIGSGPNCDGQVVTLHDLLGLGELLPNTVTGLQGNLGEVALKNLNRFDAAVADRSFPNKGTYDHMNADEASQIENDDGTRQRETR